MPARRGLDRTTAPRPLHHLAAPLAVALLLIATAAGAVCQPADTQLCLDGGRFQAEVTWIDFQGHVGSGHAVPITDDTGFFWFFAAANVELVVKVLDGNALNGHFWFFYGALSNVEYYLTLTDTTTGKRKTYHNPAGTFASVGDTQGMRNGATTADPLLSSASHVDARHVDAPLLLPSASHVDEPGLDAPEWGAGASPANAEAACAPSATALCLNSGRFRVEVKWRDFKGASGTGKAVALTGDTGYFWFFDAANVELIVKVLDGTSLNDHFWVFYGALSNVQYEMTVTDLQTGETRSYVNPSGRFASIGDTLGFPPEKPVGYAATARSLATRMVLAATDAERRAVLLEILAELKIGVYEPSTGRAILEGAERSAGDFYLYDFELEMLVQSLARRDRWSLSDLTAQINGLGIVPQGTRLLPAELIDVLTTGVLASRSSPDDAASLIPLLVRELGLLADAAFDLAERPGAGVRFDALSRFLIVADLLLPMIDEAVPVAGLSSFDRSPGYTASSLVGPLVSPASACEEIDGDPQAKRDAGKILKALSKKLLGKVSKIGKVAIDALHGSLLALSVRVEALDSALRTHYGHAAAGKPLTFRVKVTMLDQLPEKLIECGWLLGVDFPKQGPIGGVSVLWAAGELREHGTLSCGGTVCMSQTGANGIATLTFQPKKEGRPPIGMTTENTALVEGIALYQSKHRNRLGSIAQFVTPKSGTTRWFVEFHEVPDLELQIDSVIDLGAQGISVMKAWGKSTVDLSYEDGKGFVGSDPLSHGVFPSNQSGCSMVWSNGGPARFEVLRGDFTTAAGPGETPSLALTTRWGSTALTVTTSCPRMPPRTTPSGGWGELFTAAHIGQIDRTSGGYEITGWTHLGGEIVAVKTLASTCAGTCTEQTQLTVRRRRPD